MFCVKETKMKKVYFKAVPLLLCYTHCGLAFQFQCPACNPMRKREKERKREKGTIEETKLLQWSEGERER